MHRWPDTKPLHAAAAAAAAAAASHVPQNPKTVQGHCGLSRSRHGDLQHELCGFSASPLHLSFS